jgi:hypothetical protein
MGSGDWDLDRDFTNSGDLDKDFTGEGDLS